MKKALLLSVFFLLTLALRAQNLYFPPTIGSTWDTIQPSSLGWCQPQIDSLYDYLQSENSKAFILLQDGKIVLERYFGTFTADSLWYWASAGKTLTGFTVGIAQQEGHLDIGDTTAHYIGAGWTSATAAQEEKITIRHQLTMTSGLNELAAGDPNCTLPSCLPYLADAGTRWAYHTGVYTLLDSVIEAATGLTLNAYINQKIKIPTGMTGSFFQSGYNNVFVSKPRSMARFGLLLLARGNWNGNQILTDTAYFHAMTHPSQNLNNSYGYLTWLNGQSSYLLPYFQVPIPGPICPAAPADMFAAVGKNGQLISVAPSQNLVFIRMGNASNTSDVSTQLADTIWQHINRLACGANAVSEAQENGFSVWPNPVTDRLNLEYRLADADMVTVELLDLQGRVILRKEIGADASGGRLVLELPSSLPAGVYGLALETDARRVYRLVVKIARL
jgi:CubicO group peptidase (beta-lactamase class C family)